MSDHATSHSINMDTGAMAGIAAEGILLAGGMCAILLQVAHPAVARGVARHSNFTWRAMDRLRATMTYVYAMTFGDPEERRVIRDHVNRVHRGVNGPGYDAFDPDLQLWVAATLYHTSRMLYERWVGHLDRDTAEAAYRQYRVLGVALQMRDDQWPADQAAFRSYWKDTLDRLQVTDAARGVCHDLFHPRCIPAWMRAAMPLNRLITGGLLPERLRDAYGIEWNARRAWRFHAFSNGTRLIYPHLPRTIRQLPKTWYLHDMRRRLAHDERGGRAHHAPTHV